MGLNEELFERALRTLPGGVSSPVRAFGAVGGAPRFITKAKGAGFEDAEGNRYLDFVLSWGPLILGHAHEEVVAAVREAVDRGLSYGAPHEEEVRLAELVVQSYPAMEQVRFTSSGTEAVMSAIRLARGVTRRPRIVKFSGCYHGHSDGLLVAAGSGATTFGEPSSAGVPKEIASLTTVLPLDDEDRFVEFMARQGDEVAVVVIEPIPANNGLLRQRPEFLATLRQVTRHHGSLLLFDEVITGFRVGRGGAAELYDIDPDLAAFGKVIGGGMPVGAFGGSAAAMTHLAPTGRVYQAGTLSGNPVAMAAGRKTLEILERDAVWDRLESLGGRLEAGMQEALKAGYPVGFVRQGSIFWLYFGGGPPPRSAESVTREGAEPYARFFHACLDRHVYLAPSAFEVGFLCTAHTEEDIDRAVETFAAGLGSMFS